MAISGETLKAVTKPEDHPRIETSKIGVLLVNLGTPDGTDKTSMRRYLKEFLSDKRVIEWPRSIWLPVLYGIVLNTRPKKSGALYDKIWNWERNESPLRTYTRSQGEKLGAALASHSEIIVDWGMATASLRSSRSERLDRGLQAHSLMFPLYPQYSATTTATVNDKFFEALIKMRFMPATRTVPSYQDEAVYIDALATSIEKHYATLDFEPELLIASYHGIPQSYFKRGDPTPAIAGRRRGYCANGSAGARTS